MWLQYQVCLFVSIRELNVAIRIMAASDEREPVGLSLVGIGTRRLNDETSQAL
jgi:hypothetical protein